MSVGEGRRIFFEIDSVLTEVLTIKLAAYHYNFSERTIRQWCDEGRISAMIFEGRWYIPKIELDSYARRENQVKSIVKYS